MYVLDDPANFVIPINNFYNLYLNYLCDLKSKKNLIMSSLISINVNRRALRTKLLLKFQKHLIFIYIAM